jgi:hypothetical protein
MFPIVARTESQATRLGIEKMVGCNPPLKWIRTEKQLTDREMVRVANSKKMMRIRGVLTKTRKKMAKTT